MIAVLCACDIRPLLYFITVEYVIYTMKVKIIIISISMPSSTVTLSLELLMEPTVLLRRGQPFLYTTAKEIAYDFVQLVHY